MSVMYTVTGYPGEWRSRAIEHRKKYQYRSRGRVQSQSTMGKCSVIAYRRADSADPGERERAEKHRPAGQGKQHQPDHRGQMDENEPGQHHDVISGGAPPRPLRSVDRRLVTNGLLDRLDRQAAHLWPNEIVVLRDGNPVSRRRVRGGG